jgi:O-antigen/teichoic acid export membrane protein
MFLPKKYISVEAVLMVSVIAQLVKVILYYFVTSKNSLLTGKKYNKCSIETKAIQLVKMSMPFLFMGLFSMLSNQLPILFLNANSGAEQVAYFNSANKLLLPIELFITAAMTALFPNLSKLYYVNKAKFKYKIKVALTVIICLGVLGAITVSLFSSEIVSLIYGESYRNTSLVMVYQSWFTLAFALFGFFGSIFSSADKQKLLSYLSIVYAAISVPILWLGSHFGAVYLSLAFIVTALINISYHWYFVQKILPTPFSKTFVIKLLLLIFIPLTMSFFIPENLDLFYRLFIYIIVIFIFSISLRRRVYSLWKEM